MITLKNHFGGNVTYIVGKYIINGCQTFHVDASGEVFEKYKVPNQIREEVLKLVNENIDEDFKEAIQRAEVKVRKAVAMQGYGLDVLINDEDWSVRKAVAKQGYGLDVLIKDEDWCVRRTVSEILKTKKQ